MKGWLLGNALMFMSGRLFPFSVAFSIVIRADQRTKKGLLVRFTNHISWKRTNDYFSVFLLIGKCWIFEGDLLHWFSVFKLLDKFRNSFFLDGRSRIADRVSWVWRTEFWIWNFRSHSISCIIRTKNVDWSILIIQAPSHTMGSSVDCVFLCKLWIYTKSTSEWLLLWLELSRILLALSI